MDSEKNNSLMYDVIEHMEYMVRIIDENGIMIYMNRKMREVFGDRTGQRCYALLSSGTKCADCVSERCRAGGTVQSKTETVGDRVYRVIASPVRMSRREKFSVEIFEDVTEQIKIQEENLKNYEKLKSDIEFAKQVQIRALPENGSHAGLLCVDSCYCPSEALGGDIFDVITVDENKSLFYIADVLGHGIRASLFTIFLRQVIRGLKEEAGDLRAILNALLEHYRELHTDGEQYFSVLIGLYDRRESAVSFLNAGHNCLPLIVREDGRSEEVPVTGMPVCGLLRQTAHRIVTVPVKKHDKIFLYTDGITEVYNADKKEYFGLEGLLRVIRRAGQQKDRHTGRQEGDESLAARIVREAGRFSRRGNTDDMAVVIAEIL